MAKDAADTKDVRFAQGEIDCLIDMNTEGGEHKGRVVLADVLTKLGSLGGLINKQVSNQLGRVRKGVKTDLLVLAAHAKLG